MNCGHETKQFLALPHSGYHFVDVQGHSFIFMYYVGFHVFWHIFPIHSYSANYTAQKDNERQQVKNKTDLCIM